MAGQVYSKAAELLAGIRQQIDEGEGQRASRRNAVAGIRSVWTLDRS
jgi:hypothetical protein